MRQLTFDWPDLQVKRLPSTRYQGSKAKLVRRIGEIVKELPFDTVLDAFGGTGVVGYWLKQEGKRVTYNDFLRFNYLIGLALIENNRVTLSDTDVDMLLCPQPGRAYKTFIADTFQGIYYTDEENRWLDIVVQNIAALQDKYKQAMAYYALFQACLVKRPFNLFHRRNLYLRFAEVDRSFGNKVTWDTPFEVHFRAFVDEINSLVLDNGRENRALNEDVENIEGDFDLVYIDPPYISRRGIGVDYHHFYHFLEGMTRYDRWPEMVDYTSKHRRLRPIYSPWTDKGAIHDAFRRLFNRFRDAILVVSYRSDGIPSIEALERMMRAVKNR
ncbi:MAG TPA: DNA methyltransferase, partial [Desulfobacterales bacterium]|nr:DNA methyltransferase [Desulfobacterales bacterium]